jgi:hypothetical protein
MKNTHKRRVNDHLAKLEKLGRRNRREEKLTLIEMIY